MHTAASIIFFTTVSGAGYGLLFWLSILSAAGKLPADRWLGFTGFAVAFTMIGAGLLSSLLHLGHRERAWRALSQWRSSWLSREGVMAMVTFVPAGLAAFGWVILGESDGLWRVMSLLSAAGAVLTVACTGMIYASLQAIPRWHHPAVLPCYLLFAAYSGSLLLNFIIVVFRPERAEYSAQIALLTIAAAGFVKLGYWYSIDNEKPLSDRASATGLTGGRVRSLDPPNEEESYLQTEMSYVIARKHADKLRRISALATFVAPTVAIILQIYAVTPAAQDMNITVIVLAGLAIPFAAVGLAVERWLFFAEAKHKITLFYSAEAV